MELKTPDIEIWAQETMRRGRVPTPKSHEVTDSLCGRGGHRKQSICCFGEWLSSSANLAPPPAPGGAPTQEGIPLAQGRREKKPS